MIMCWPLTEWNAFNIAHNNHSLCRVSLGKPLNQTDTVVRFSWLMVPESIPIFSPTYLAMVFLGTASITGSQWIRLNGNSAVRLEMVSLSCTAHYQPDTTQDFHYSYSKWNANILKMLIWLDTLDSSIIGYCSQLFPYTVWLKVYVLITCLEAKEDEQPVYFRNATWRWLLVWRGRKKPPSFTMRQIHTSALKTCTSIIFFCSGMYGSFQREQILHLI